MTTFANKLPPQFTLRAVLFVMLLAALALGWYSAVRRQRLEVSRLAAQVDYARTELERSQSHAELLGRAQMRPDAPSQGTLWGAKLQRSNFQSVTIIAGDSAFNLASFIGANLEGATFTAGASSFQGAQFDHANLARARLTGDVSAFQHASFAHANLSGAVLTGGSSAFQNVSIEHARLIGAKLNFSSASAFQQVNINGTQFQGADLSLLNAGEMANCYFDTPPRYDEKTKFPPRFDPAAEGWHLVTGKSE